MSVIHKLPLCNTGNLHAPDVGHIFQEDSEGNMLKKE